MVLRNTLANLGHLRLPTPIKTYNSTAANIANKTKLQRKPRSMNMKFYWVYDWVNQGQFIVYWRPGVDNFGDYYTKYHPPSHHIKVRSHCVRDLPQLHSSIRWGFVIMIKMVSVLNVLAKVNNILLRNIEVHTNIET